VEPLSEENKKDVISGGVLEDSIPEKVIPVPDKPKAKRPKADKPKAKRPKADKEKADSRKSEVIGSAYDFSLKVKENSERRSVEAKPLRRSLEGLKDSPYRSGTRNNTFRIAFALSLKTKVSEKVKTEFPSVISLKTKIAKAGFDTGKGYSRSDISEIGKALGLKVDPGFSGISVGSTRFSVYREKSGKNRLYYPGVNNPIDDRPKS
tara:strand:+ start:2327 stop:2947 length:621 start_codon:yes stop_codon:yes gene_type:complete